MRATITRFTTTMLMIVLLLGLSIHSAGADDPLDQWLLEKALTEVGDRRNVVKPGDVQRLEFPHSGLTRYQVKLVDEETGETYRIVMDETGARQSLETARLEEAIAHDARLAHFMAEDTANSIDAAMETLEKTPHGRLSSNLFDRLGSLGATHPLTVAVWLKADEIGSYERPDLGHLPAQVEAGDAPLEPYVPNRMKVSDPNQIEESPDSKVLADRVEAIRAAQDENRFAIEDARQENLNFLKSQMTALHAPLLADMSRMGVEPKYVSPVAPLVYVELTRSAILETVLNDYVDTIYGPNVNQDGMSIAKPTQKADIVDNWFGFDGTGVDVAITEDSRVDWPHTYLITGTTRVPGDPEVDYHATATAGMVASQHGTQQGIAQGPTMFSANGTSYDDADMAAALDWAATTQNVDVMNNSWGGNRDSGALNEHDRHADYLVRHSVCTIIAIAHNDGTNPIYYVRSPGKAYNVITVGAYDDNNTLTWDDDVIAGYSNYNDPDTGCEKPEVAASGSNIISTLMGNAIGDAGSGTSYAAPMVSGEAALLMDRNSILESWPEAIKAIIMATALHNIEGASRLSEKDGAGGVDMRAALRVADEHWWDASSVYEGDLPRQYSVYAFAGQTIRAAIAWDANPNATYTTDPLEADIDLRLKNPSGTIVATSSSGSNSFEIVEYTAPTTGTYTLEAYVFNWSGTDYTYLGAAWWPGQRVLATPIQTYDSPPISRDYYQFNPNAGYWNVVGIRSPDATTSNNYNIHLYADSAFGDPDDYTWLEDSTLSTVMVDYVVVDGNHAPAGDYFAEVQAATGSGNYPIQFWNPALSATDGTYTATFTTLFLLQAYDAYLSAGTRKYFALKVESGNADFGMALHDSTLGSSATYYQGRSQRVVQADSNGAGGSEFMNYLAPTSDDMGLILWNNGSTTTTTVKLYVDTTIPNGSIVINGGAPYTNSVNVTLTLSGVDGQTGVAEMRFLNSGGSWSAWEPYGTGKSWSLPVGDGPKTVYVQYKNNAGMTSTAYSDAIVLDTAVPAPNPLTWATEPYELNTSQIRMLAVAASDPSEPISYFFNYTTSPTGGAGGTDSGWIGNTTYTDSGLGINHRYGYQVKARDGSLNETDYSAISYDYTDIETPTGITFGAITATSIQARSTNTPSGLTRGSSGLYIQNTTAGTISGWKQNNNLWTSGGLTPNTSYTFRAIARNGDANGTPWSPGSSRYTFANLPGAAAFSNITQTSIRANWTANSNPAGTQYYCQNLTAGTGSGWTTSTSWNNSGLTCGTSYSFRVKARNGDGVETGWRSLGSASTLPCADVCECDLNTDHSCNILDYQLFIQDWGRSNCGTPPGSGNPPNDCECDLDTNGNCNILDYQLFIQDWGRDDCP